MDILKEKLGGCFTFKLDEPWSKEEAVKLPARTLAYIGDAVYELGLRLNHVAVGIDGVGHLHDSLVGIVSSPAQAKLFMQILPELPEDEQQLLKTWRNAKIPGRYGSGTRGEYSRATALEAWIGYLFIIGSHDRVRDLLEKALKL